MTFYMNTRGTAKANNLTDIHIEGGQGFMMTKNNVLLNSLTKKFETVGAAL